MSSKKGATWIEYTLATGLFVALAVIMITWGKSFTEEKTDAAITMASGRMDCQQIRIDAVLDRSVADTCMVTIVNRGALNVRRVLVRYGDSQAEVDDLRISEIMRQETGNEGILMAENLFGYKAELLPLVDAGEELVGCKDKILEIDCR
ncbi:MAG: hypothetical protein AABY09_03330 [Nanoarchaeota archaeon]